MAVSDHEKKMVQLQHDMRNSQKDLAEFLSDMTSWEDEIKQKEKQLLTQKQDTDQSLPPVRNSLHQKKKKKKQKEKGEVNGTAGKPKRISGYDYRSWDKFDVDKMCEDIDKEETKNSDSSEYETDEEWEIERKKQQALMEKDRGNDLFKQGDYSSAIEAYTTGMTLDPTNPLLPANRAMALLKQEKYAAAELDCATALSLDPLYVKAYLRRGSARFGLKKFIEAKEDFEKVLKLEPQNKKAKLEIENIDKELSKEKMVAQTEPAASPDTGIVYAITKPPHERSKKPLKRIEVEEVGLDDDELQKAAIAKLIASQSDTKKQMTQRDNQMFEQLTGSSDLVKSEVLKNISINDKNQTSGNKENKQDKSQQNIVKSELKSSNDQDNTTGTTRLKPSVAMTTDTKLDLSSVSDSKHSDDSPSVSPRSLPVPQTSFQFQKDYKSVKSNLEAFYHYLKKIDPCQYQKLFGEAMEAEILMKMLTVFKDYYISSNEDFYPHLCNLTQVKRFSMTVMFLSRKDQQVLKELFDHLRNKGNVDNSELDKLAKKYELR